MAYMNHAGLLQRALKAVDMIATDSTVDDVVKASSLSDVRIHINKYLAAQGSVDQDAGEVVFTEAPVEAVPPRRRKRRDTGEANVGDGG